MKNLNRQVERLAALSTTSLQALFEGNVLALVVKPFAEEEECVNWTNVLNKRATFERYTNAPNVSVSKIGMTFFETELEAEKVALYFDIAATFSKALDAVFEPQKNPLSKITKAIGAVWESGIQVGELNGKKMCPGIIRCVEHTEDGGLPPHQDRLEKDTKVKDSQLKGQLAVNLYLQTATEGGELLIWPAKLSQEEVDNLYTGEYDFMDVSQLPKPIVIKPETGDMILFRSDCIHAVNPCEGVNRIAASCSIGYYGNDRPLMHWS